MSAFPNARFLKSANEASQFVEDRGSEVAFAGRSNSGKSSAINALTQRHALARTSKTPGQTRLINFFELEPGRRLVDLPGYGFAQVPRPMREHWKQLLESYFRVRESLRALFIIMDARRPLEPTDWVMLEYAERRGRAVHLLLSKADKLSRSTALATLVSVRRDIGARATAQLFSATRRLGVDEARRELLRCLSAKNGPATEAVAGPD